MGRLIYLMNTSLDGFVETPDHGLDWTMVDEELHTWFNERVREAAALLHGRRLYELMAASWPTGADDPAATPAMREFAGLWTAKPKIVFSRTLTRVDWNSRLVEGDVADVVARLRTEFEGDLHLGGARLAAEFVRRGLVDEYWLVVHPVAIGRGTPYFPALHEPLRLRLLDRHTFSSGVTFLAYAPA